jgi:hypothetical protein
MDQGDGRDVKQNMGSGYNLSDSVMLNGMEPVSMTRSENALAGVARELDPRMDETALPPIQIRDSDQAQPKPIWNTTAWIAKAMINKRKKIGISHVAGLRTSHTFQSSSGFFGFAIWTSLIILISSKSD